MRLIALGPKRRSSCRAARRLAIVVTCAAGLGTTPIAVRAQSHALTLSEVLDLRRRGVSSRQILRSAQEYCVAFTVNESVESQLVAVGADTVLIGGIRQSCVAALPSVQHPPGVLLDDNFGALSSLGTIAATDRLCTARPDSQGLRVENRREIGCAIAYPFELDDSNVRVELTVVALQGKPGAMVALGFGKDSLSWDQYSFGITNEDRFELCMSVRGRCRQLLYRRRVIPNRTERRPEIRLTAEIRGREMSLFIDDERVGVYTAARAVVGSISLGVGAASTAVFRRLRVERLEGLTTSR